MEDRFEITQSSADLYVGLHIHQSVDRRTIYVNQSIYLHRILLRFGFADCHIISTPADPNLQLDDTSDPPDAVAFGYSAAVGCLIFAQTLTRPDISFAVSRVAQFSANPQRPHYQAVSRIYRYLAGTLQLSLCFDGNVSQNFLEAFADADYAGDTTDRKSRSGSLLLLNRTPVSWSSRKQACVSTSTTEAEYVAASSTTKDIIWFRRLLSNLGFHQTAPTPLFSDNQSAIRLVHNPEYHRRTKHIDIVYHFIRDHQRQGAINVCYTPTETQLADLFTKALPTDRFTYLRKCIGLLLCPSEDKSLT